MFIGESAIVPVDQKQVDEIKEILDAEFTKSLDEKTLVYTFNKIPQALSLCVKVKLMDVVNKTMLEISPPVIGPYILVEPQQFCRIVDLFRDLQQRKLAPITHEAIYYMDKTPHEHGANTEIIYDTIDCYYGVAWSDDNKDYVFYSTSAVYLSGHIEYNPELTRFRGKKKLNSRTVCDISRATVINAALNMPLTIKKYEDELIDRMVFRTASAAPTTTAAPTAAAPAKKRKVAPRKK